MKKGKIEELKEIRKFLIEINKNKDIKGKSKVLKNNINISVFFLSLANSISEILILVSS